MKVFVLFTPLSFLLPLWLLGRGLLAKEFVRILCQARALFQGMGALHHPPGMKPGMSSAVLTPMSKVFSAASAKKRWAGTLRWGERSREGWKVTQGRPWWRPLKVDHVRTAMQPYENGKRVFRSILCTSVCSWSAWSKTVLPAACVLPGLTGRDNTVPWELKKDGCCVNPIYLWLDSSGCPFFSVLSKFSTIDMYYLCDKNYV